MTQQDTQYPVERIVRGCTYRLLARACEEWLGPRPLLADSDAGATLNLTRGTLCARLTAAPGAALPERVHEQLKQLEVIYDSTGDLLDVQDHNLWPTVIVAADYYAIRNPMPSPVDRWDGTLAIEIAYVLTSLLLIRAPLAIYLRLAAAPLFIPAAALGRGGATAPSDRINVACIGLGWMGYDGHLKDYAHQD